MAQLNFNRAPYYDDYNTGANYVRILFRDGFPVQTRELNNIQSAFQDQLRMFGEHVFKNGARVSGARMMDVNYDYLLIRTLNLISMQISEQEILLQISKQIETILEK